MKIEINEKNVVYKNLPSGLNGLRILHLSDFHTRGYQAVEQAVYNAMRSLKPDMVIISGDFCYHFGLSINLLKSSTSDHHKYKLISRYGIWMPPETDKAKAVLEKLLDGYECPLGVWGSRGNHDPFEFQGMISDINMSLLVNSSAVVEHNGCKIGITGLDCSKRSSYDLVSILKTAPSVDFNIAISHYPENGEPLIAGGMDLVLGGHTHGGQICLPGGKPILTHSRTGSYYAKGLICYLDGWVHVSRGLGKVMLPIRVNCPPEITLLRVVS